MTVANCFNGIFSLSATPRVLIEEFLLIANKGGIAAWAPSSLAFPSVNTPINAAMYEAIFVDNERVLGSAATTARIEAYLNHPYLPLVLFESFTYLGDPAVELAMPASLALNGSVSPGPITMGEDVTYTINYTVSNADQAPGLTVIGRLPQHTTFQSASIPPTAINGRAITWELGDVAAGSYSLTLVAEVGISGLDHGQAIENEVELFDASGGNQTINLQTTVSDRLIAGLSAGNDSPIELGSKTTLSASVVEGTNVVYTWNFGDSSPTKTGQTVTHTYPAVGNYTAQVTASNGINSEAETTPITIVDVPPEARFVSSSPDMPGQTTTFQSISEGTNLTLTWNFGDGSPAQTAPNPIITHDYGATGPYPVLLTATNSAGSHTASSLVHIIDSVIPPVAGFYSTSPDELGQPTSFINAGQDGGDVESNVDYYWQFGDGASSTDKNPAHTYGAIGLYTVTATITNSLGSDTHTEPVMITDVPISGLSVTFNSPLPSGQAGAFSAQVAQGTNVTFTWQFGDSSPPQIGNSVQHTYASGGSYTVQVTAANSVSSQSYSGLLVVQGSAPESIVVYLPIVIK
jgi:PKD repeat protein